MFLKYSMGKIMFMRHHNKTLSSVSTVLMAALLISATTLPGVAATAEEAKAFAENAVAHIKAVGKEQAFADFSRKDGGFVDGELYMFCYEKDGTNVAHGGNPAFVGKNLLDVKDPDGVQVNAEIIKLGMSQG